jgi:hypothetical protein
MLGTALIHPDKREVIPLMPEPIIKQDGTEKNDCERNAAKRFITKLRQDHPHLKVIVTEDSLSSNAPHIETLQDHDLHYILGGKEGDHPYLFEQVETAEHAGRVTYYDRHDPETGNETFNTLKNQGYHFEHNYGHGYQHLSVVFAILMMLAFLVDQVQQLCCPLFQAVWAKLGSKRRLWEKMRALFYDYALDSMRQLLEALLYGLKKPTPSFAVDSS